MTLSLFQEQDPGADRRPARRAWRPQVVLQETPRAQFRPLSCGSILNGVTNESLPFRWSINPYRGCEFGCGYCFARYTHAYLDHQDPASFENRIYVKFQAASVLEEELHPEAVRDRPIALGTATDPYQPGEKRFEVTRRILELLARCPGVDLSITTKSPLILRDLELLQRIRAVGSLRVNISLVTLHPGLARILEGHAPTPRRRLDTIRALSSAGIGVSTFVMPILPGITDSVAELRSLLRAAKTAGAASAHGQPVRLMGASWRQFRQTLAASFPHLLDWYERSLRRGVGGFPPETTAPIMESFEAIRREVGLEEVRGSAPQGRPAGDQAYLTF